MDHEEIQHREGQFWHQSQEMQKQPRGSARRTEPMGIVLSSVSEAPLGLMLSRDTEKELEEFVQPTPGQSISIEGGIHICGKLVSFPQH